MTLENKKTAQNAIDAPVKPGVANCVNRSRNRQRATCTNLETNMKPFANASATILWAKALTSRLEALTSANLLSVAAMAADHHKALDAFAKEPDTTTDAKESLLKLLL